MRARRERIDFARGGAPTERTVEAAKPPTTADPANADPVRLRQPARSATGRAQQSGSQLAESCQGMVRSIAWKIHRRLPPHVELDDLIGYGQLGLQQAARDYDAARAAGPGGASFTTFAWYRIRGAILDGISQMSWFSRAEYHARKYERMADDVLSLEQAERAATTIAVADEAGWLGRTCGSLTVAYLACFGNADRPEAIKDGSPSPEDDASGREMIQTLHTLIDALPPDAGSLIRMTYMEDLTLHEAAKRLGISKSWASRLHARTLERLAHSLRLLGAAD